jgi:predicted phosphohydrolase
MPKNFTKRKYVSPKALEEFEGKEKHIYHRKLKRQEKDRAEELEKEYESKLEDNNS